MATQEYARPAGEHPPRDKTRLSAWGLTQQYEFERSLDYGQVVVARWTSSHDWHMAYARILKKNRQSAKVGLISGFYTTKGYTGPDREFTLPMMGELTSAHSKWSWNNGVFSLEWWQAHLMDSYDSAEKEKNRDAIRARLAREMTDLDSMMDLDNETKSKRTTFEGRRGR